jgi:hypothetical protein
MQLHKKMYAELVLTLNVDAQSGADLKHAER